MSLHVCGGAAVSHTEQRRRTAGGEKEGKQVERTGWRRRRLPGGLAWLYAARNRRNKGSLWHAFFFFQPMPSHLPFLHICSHYVMFFFLSSPSSCPCSYYNLLCIVLYLCSTHSFHFCPCVFERPLTLPSLHGK